MAKKEIEGFQRELEIEQDVGGQDGGESTENEEEPENEENESMSNRNISVEVNDLWYYIAYILIIRTRTSIRSILRKSFLC